jgi:hypothetical protein
MIVRVWRGYGAVAEGEAYPKHLLHSVRPRLQQLPGFRGVYLLSHRRLEEIEFLVLTLWDSMEAVRAFAGEPGPGSSGTRGPGLARTVRQYRTALRGFGRAGCSRLIS